MGGGWGEGSGGRLSERQPEHDMDEGLGKESRGPSVLNVLSRCSCTLRLVLFALDGSICMHIT